jgi:hypothetical protein
MLLYTAVSAMAQLETRGTTPALLYPQAMATGDFNNDGKQDLAVASVYNDNGITLLLGNGNGTFRVGSEFAVGVGTNSVTVADFNGDGNLDLATVQYLGNVVSVLFGNGDGTFEAPVDYLTAAAPTFVAAGDFNGDGFPDLILLEDSPSGHYLSVFLNNGDGTFGARLDTPTATPYVLGLGDFNRDGKLDAAVGGDNGLQIFLGNGDGTFTPGAIYSGVITYGSMPLPAADLRGIGILDLISPGDGNDSVEVFLGNGDGTFQPEKRYFAVWPVCTAVGDFNGDGKLDIVACDNEPSRVSGVSVLLGNGDGTFQKANFYPAGAQAVAAVVADFNGDKKPDVAIADNLYSYVTTMLNTGVVSFSPTTPITPPVTLLGATSPPRSAKLTNNGASNLNISSVKSSGPPFHVTTTCKGSIAPGGSCAITATFTAQTEGVTTGTVSINDSASSRPQVVELSGTGTGVKLVPASLTFPAQKVGTQSAPQTVQLTNIGSAPLNFSRTLYVSGNNPYDYSESDNCGTQIAAGASCTISVTFKPRKTGTRTANVTITDDGGGSPQILPLTGTGS